MKAIVYRRYGSPDVLALQDVQKPQFPRTATCSSGFTPPPLNPLDWHLLRGEPYVVRPTAAGANPSATPRASTWPASSRRSAGT